MCVTVGVKGSDEPADRPAETKAEDEEQEQEEPPEESPPTEDADPEQDFILTEVVDLTANTITNGR